jgi:hypothetical protein
MDDFPRRYEAVILFCQHNESAHRMVNRHSKEISEAVNLAAGIEKSAN